MARDSWRLRRGRGAYSDRSDWGTFEIDDQVFNGAFGRRAYIDHMVKVRREKPGVVFYSARADEKADVERQLLREAGGLVDAGAFCGPDEPGRMISMSNPKSADQNTVDLIRSKSAISNIMIDPKYFTELKASYEISVDKQYNGFERFKSIITGKSPKEEQEMSLIKTLTWVEQKQDAEHVNAPTAADLVKLEGEELIEVKTIWDRLNEASSKTKSADIKPFVRLTLLGEYELERLRIRADA